MTREEAITVASETYGWLKTDREREALETLIPELSKSDGERIRKSLIKFLTDIKEISESGRTTWAVRKEDAEMCKSFLSYLEKQKEQKPEPKRIFPKFAIGDTVCRPMWSDHTIREIYVDYDDSTYICVNEDGAESHIPFSEQDEWEKKEQKPAEWDELQAEFKSINEAFEDGKKEVVAHPKKYGLCKPVEWSEEDKAHIESLLKRLDGICKKGATFTQTRFAVSEDMDWLKSLRLQPHTVSIKDATKFGNLEYERGVKDGIQSEKSRQWKPSDEQMRELKTSYSYWHGITAEVPNTKLLESLYNDLKKLA